MRSARTPTASRQHSARWRGRWGRSTRGRKGRKPARAATRRSRTGSDGRMNKQEFANELAERCEFSKAEAGRVVDAVLDSVTEALTDRDEVNLPGFGKFVSQKRRGREG